MADGKTEVANKSGEEDYLNILSSKHYHLLTLLFT